MLPIGGTKNRHETQPAVCKRRGHHHWGGQRAQNKGVPKQRLNKREVDGRSNISPEEAKNQYKEKLRE